MEAPLRGFKAGEIILQLSKNRRVLEITKKKKIWKRLNYKKKKKNLLLTFFVFADCHFNLFSKNFCFNEYLFC